MPTGFVSWMGNVERDDSIEQVVNERVATMTSEAREDFHILAMFWDTCLQSEKVVICGDSVFVGTIRDKILTLVPDDALDIHKLIWMWDADRVHVQRIAVKHIKEAMML